MLTSRSSVPISTKARNGYGVTARGDATLKSLYERQWDISSAVSVRMCRYVDFR